MISAKRFSILFLVFVSLFLLSGSGAIESAESPDNNAEDLHQLATTQKNFPSLVKDIWTATASSATGYHLSFDGGLFFSTRNENDSNDSTEKWWFTNGYGAQPAPFANVSNISTKSYKYNSTSSLFFLTLDGSDEWELWSSNDTLQGSYRLLRRKGNYFDGAVVLNNIVYFFEQSPNRPIYLWRSDGTQKGTYSIRTATPRLSTPLQVGNLVYYTAYNYPLEKAELWRLDGTRRGTYLITAFEKDFWVELIGSIGETLYYTVQDRADKNKQANASVWKYEFGKTKLVFTENQVQSIQGVTLEDWVLIKVNTKDGKKQLWSYNNKWMTPLAMTDSDMFERKGNLIYFEKQADHTLWRTDGTKAGTFVLKSFGGYASLTLVHSPEALPYLYFILNLGDSTALWRTDGSAEGTVLVKRSYEGGTLNVRTYRADKFVFSLAGVNGSNDQQAIEQLWISDGTEAGTIKLSTGGYIAQFNQIGETSEKASDWAAFIVQQPPQPDNHNRYELWRTDYTPQGTYKLHSLTQYDFIVAGKRVYFSADDGLHGYELWTSDGTPTGTKLLRDINTQPSSANPSSFTKAGNLICFTAGEYELWCSDGSEKGTQRITQLSPQYARTFYKGYLYFQQGISPNEEVWRTKGTPQSTTPSELPTMFLNDNNVEVNGILYTDHYEPDSPFCYYYCGYTIDLWRTDGTEKGTYRLANMDYTYTEYAPEQPITHGGDVEIVNNLIVYTGFAKKDEQGNTKLGVWATDGTINGSYLLKNVNTVSNRGSIRLISTGRQVFVPMTFASSYGGGSKYNYFSTDIYRTDGTEKGSYPLNFNGDPSNFFVVDNAVYFNLDYEDATQLWYSDGTKKGTHLVSEKIGNSKKKSAIAPIAGLNGKLYFSAEDSQGVPYLWVTDSTDQGTIKIKKMPSLFASQGVTVNQTIFFRQSIQVSPESWSSQLWRTDGTQKGTMPVYFENGQPVVTGELAVMNNTLYFSADDGIHGTELWRLTP